MPNTQFSASPKPIGKSRFALTSALLRSSLRRSLCHLTVCCLATILLGTSADAQLPDFGQQLSELFGGENSTLEATETVSALDKPAPTTIGDFREIQDIASSVAPKVIDATVGVQLGAAYASGVVVSADGYVLTASHVAGAPGRRVQLSFADGRKTSGRTLGLNPDVDGALIKIDDPGPWPFVPMAGADNQPKAGDWCMATGHPGGFEAGRKPPVRVGRIIFANGYTIRSDCPIEPGDSGGPLVDLNGNVIGVHSRIFNDATGNLHVPIVTFSRTWDQLAAGEISQLAPSSGFLAQFDFNQDGKLTLQELPVDGTRRRVLRRLADEYGFDVNQPHSIDELRKTIGLNIAKKQTNTRLRPGQMLFTAPKNDEMLSEYKYTRGMSLMNVFRRVTRDGSDVTVNVLANGQEVCFGTIVDIDGWVVSKASEIEAVGEDARLSVHLADSRRFGAKMVHIDKQYDLAWLKIAGDKLPQINWAVPAPKLSQWVVSTSRGRMPLSAGVVSVESRKIRASPGFMGVGGSRNRTDAYVETIVPESGAAKSDLKIGDVIVGVNDVVVRSFRDLSTQVRGYLPGDAIHLRVKRGDKEEKVTVRLAHRRDPNADNNEEKMMGRLSIRRDGFPFAFRHDSVLKPEECGGPLVDLDGNVVGINIARKQRTGSLAVTAETISRLLETAKQKVPAKVNDKRDGESQES